jgi:hypothetical protein
MGGRGCGKIMPPTEKTKVFIEKPVPVPLCLPQIPQTDLQGKRLVITRTILWPHVKIMIWEYNH